MAALDKTFRGVYNLWNIKLMKVENIKVEQGVPAFTSEKRGGFLGMQGQVEGSGPLEVASTILISKNPEVFVKRCKEAWGDKETILLEYSPSKENPSLYTAPIVAARTVPGEKGNDLELWVSFRSKKASS